MLDVKEISKKMGVSKKTVYKYLKIYDDMLEPYTSIGKNNQKLLNEKGYKIFIKLTDQQEEKEKNVNGHDTKYIELLESQVKDLKDDKESLIRLLDQQQQLHLSLQNNLKLLEVNADSNKDSTQVDEVMKEKQAKSGQSFISKIKDIFIYKK
jgi:transposase